MSHFELFLLQDINYCYHRLKTRPRKLNENTVAKTCSAGLFAYYLHALLCCLEERAMLMAASASGCFTAAGCASGIGGKGHARFIEADARKCAEVSCCSTPGSAHRCRCQRAVAFHIEGCALDRSRAVTPKVRQNQCQTTGKM